MPRETAPGVPLFMRNAIEPPGEVQKYPLLSYSDSIAYLANYSTRLGSNLKMLADERRSLEQGPTDGIDALRINLAMRQELKRKSAAASLTRGILGYGAIKDFGGKTGLDYSRLFQRGYNPAYVGEAINVLQEMFALTTQLVLTPDTSGIVPATLVVSQLGIPMVRAVKSSLPEEGSFNVGVESYTKGGVNILSIRPDDFKGMLLRPDLSGNIGIGIIDESLDAGTVAVAMSDLVRQMRESGLPFIVNEIGFVIEKTYTGAAQRVKDAYGIDPFSVLRIADMGRDFSGWIRLDGMKLNEKDQEYRLSFAPQPALEGD